MNKIFIVLLFILLGSSLIVLNNMDGGTENSFAIVYENNKNIALPDINGKIEIMDGLYRLYDNNGLTIDYNIYNGIWTVNGQYTLTALSYILFNVMNNQQYTLTYNYVSGSISDYFEYTFASPNIANFFMSLTNYQNDRIITITTTTQNRYVLYTTNVNIFNNYQFKIQLEKGSQATSYIVPKLIPHYQDNLSLEEKEQIGMGAFGGITQILRSISDIIKPLGDIINSIFSFVNEGIINPIGDFINGIFSWF